ncbi:MAG: cobalamin biosynthesis protein [Spirochaetia bacterium]|nr:cobalamin biosynthesis protein [Spirochaetia bacterium]
MGNDLSDIKIRKEYAIYAITRHGIKIAETLQNFLPGCDLYVSSRFIDEAPDHAIEMGLPMGPTLKRTFFEYSCHIHIISIGAVVRMIKDLLKDKKTDPAVLCVDDMARFSICVLSGHAGRGNAYAEKIAFVLGAIPVVTTASDVAGTLTVDILGRDLGWKLDDEDKNVTRGCAAVVNSLKTAFIHEAGEPDFWPLDKGLPECVDYFTKIEDVNPEKYEILLIATDRIITDDYPAHDVCSVVYRPKSLILGIGCDKDTPFEIIENGLHHHFKKNKLSIKSIRAAASIDLKKEEKGIQMLCEKYGWEFYTYPAEVLDAVQGIENPSETVKKYTGSRTVAEGACLHHARAEKLLITKQSYKEDHDVHNMTLAVARIPFGSRMNEKNKKRVGKLKGKSHAGN